MFGDKGRLKKGELQEVRKKAKRNKKLVTNCNEIEIRRKKRFYKTVIRATAR